MALFSKTLNHYHLASRLPVSLESAQTIATIAVVAVVTLLLLLKLAEMISCILWYLRHGEDFAKDFYAGLASKERPEIGAVLVKHSFPRFPGNTVFSKWLRGLYGHRSTHPFVAGGFRFPTLMVATSAMAMRGMPPQGLLLGCLLAGVLPAK